MRYLGMSITLCCSALILFCSTASGLTPEEVVYLKKNGVADETIQLMLQNDRKDRERAESSISVTDDNSAVTYSTGRPSETPLSREQQLNIDRAWKMLENMFIDVKQ